MTDTLSLSVRGLVEHVFRSGSLDSGFRAASALTEGTKAHQRLQAKYGERDRKEVYLSAEITCGDLLFAVEGRCDGLLVGENDETTIEEIKSTVRDIGAMAEHETPEMHWAQACFYAYMYAAESGVGRLRVRLTYVHVDTEAVRSFEREKTLAELEAYVREAAEAYAPYARMLVKNRRLRDAGIAELEFPFEAYREGQRKLAGAVYKAIGEGCKLFARAPTGTGKTVSTLFPAIKAIGAGKLEQLFYLTARTITRTAAEDTLALMAERGLVLRSVTITAKEKVCFQDQVDCRPEHCPYANGYYDRINEAILDLLGSETLIRRETIEKYARKHVVCPFEMSLDAAYGADAVIGDYNYIFDPRISLKRLTGERKKRTVLLVDEAHNLVDRAREMYSAVLEKREFLELEREFKGVRPSLHAAAKAVNKWFVALRKQTGGDTLVSKQVPEGLAEPIEEFAAQADRELAGGGPGAGSERLLNAYFAAAAWLRTGKLYDERYVAYAEFERNEVRLKMFCMDPSHLLAQMGKGFQAHVFFSATLSPLGYYMEMLGAEEEDYSVTLGSPFDKEQWEAEVVPLSTRYADRERTKEQLTAALLDFAGRRRGNYLTFFPSYAYMNVIYEEFAARSGEEGWQTLLQTPEMAEEERERFLARFDEANEGTLVGFAVMGGIFSEGIDLTGDRLNGVAVVGVGMPQLGLERNLIRSHFDELGVSGFDYAYVYPGINKVLQAGGRLIRTERDRGLLLLVDDRYLQPKYARLLPEEWRE
ncbi:ATP-dependent DNA helicase [Cohnella cellulosilytica]|uniref:ATP-dependent DNA helicase n=1 Tax=Cohnella cellulosilytica TaxID=986710 RepID=A0ABW2FCK0_9BACL